MIQKYKISDLIAVREWVTEQLHKGPMSTCKQAVHLARFKRKHLLESFNVVLSDLRIVYSKTTNCISCKPLNRFVSWPEFNSKNSKKCKCFLSPTFKTLMNTTKRKR